MRGDPPFPSFPTSSTLPCVLLFGNHGIRARGVPMGRQRPNPSSHTTPRHHPANPFARPSIPKHPNFRYRTAVVSWSGSAPPPHHPRRQVMAAQQQHSAHGVASEAPPPLLRTPRPPPVRMANELPGLRPTPGPLVLQLNPSPPPISKAAVINAGGGHTMQTSEDGFRPFLGFAETMQVLFCEFIQVRREGGGIASGPLASRRMDPLPTPLGCAVCSCR